MKRTAEMTIAHSTISVIIPVYKESEAIHKTIEHLRALPSGGTLEIIVVDGDPLNGTINSIRDNGVITAASLKGRALQMNHGAEIASGDILIFLHADTFLPLDGLLKVEAAMSGGRYAAGAFHLGISSNRPIFRVTEQYVAFRSRLTRIPFGDQAIFMAKKYFENIGGYSEIPLMEDVELMKRIRKRGDLICFIPDKVMTSSRRWKQEGIVYCTIRNLALQIAYALGISAERLKRWYK